VPETLDRCNRALAALYPLSAGVPARVLEAGGGSHSHFTLPEGAGLYALDISHGQLARNASTPWRIQADLHALPVSPGSFGVVVCFNVVEHLDAPATALLEMAHCLAAGGVLVLGCPVRSSLKGLVTRMTPLWFHRWYYRSIVGKRDRGEGHYDVFATPFRAEISIAGLNRQLDALGFRRIFNRAYDGSAEYHLVTGSLRRRLVGLPYYVACLLGRLITLGRWRPERSDLLIVAIKER
jgi:SAM-dependent methyltransferase